MSAFDLLLARVRPARPLQRSWRNIRSLDDVPRALASHSTAGASWNRIAGLLDTHGQRAGRAATAQTLLALDSTR